MSVGATRYHLVIFSIPVYHFMVIHTIHGGPGTLHLGSPSTWVDTLGALAPRGSMPKGGLAELKHTLVPAGGESFLLMHARW